MNALLDAALGYAARGIPVYPIHWPHPTAGGTALGCSCPRGRYCDRPAKHPLVWHGVKDATTSPAQLARWWQRWPDANIGLATGIVFDALDIDGLQGMAALREQLPTVGRRHPGPLVATGGGGWHYWYAPAGYGNRPPQGLTHVDWRGLGGSVLAPPSHHASGGHYRWLRTLDQASLPEVPGALRALLQPQRPPVSPSTPGTFRPAELGHPYAQQALAAELATLAQARPRNRNRTLNRCAFKVYRYVAGGLLDEQQVTTALTTVARSLGLGAAEVRRTLASARTAAGAFPRGLPARPDHSQGGA
jgi:Bifunctional DNA primase/polymerase, N-terminal